MKNKTVFITGATSGFGEACARRYAASGNRLVLCGRRLERLKHLQSTLDAPIFPLELDVRDRKAVFQAIDSLPNDFSAIDVLVNNAGLALGLAPAPSVDLDDWEQMVDTNVKGLMYCTRAILPDMVARNQGHIVNIGSVAGTYPYPGGNAYGATKAFVRQFSLNLRADLLGSRVRVTNIEPGLAETEFSKVRFKGDDAKAAALYQGTEPLSAEDIAECVFWTTALPAHVNINALEVMPTCQAFNPLSIHRDTTA